MKKYVHLVDLVKSFPTSIYLQKSASIQPTTSLSKFGGKFNSLFIRLLSRAARGAREDRLRLAQRLALRRAVLGGRERGIQGVSTCRSFSRVLAETKNDSGGLVLGCIEANFCKLILVRAFFREAKASFTSLAWLRIWFM